MILWRLASCKLAARPVHTPTHTRTSTKPQRAGGAELAQLDSKLSAALDNQRRLVLRHFVLSLVTKALEYGGAMLNYGCLALAVFGGAWDGDGSAGGRAGRISVASFYLLMLIYSFTQVGVGKEERVHAHWRGW
jgi:hypothetical protein